MDEMTPEDLRTRADQLRAVLDAIDEEALDATSRQRAFIAGALRAVKLMQADLTEGISGDPVSRERHAR